ncbi:MAG: tRNA lysidine(34) synthetase TilS [Pirellulaceae bacterium]
MPEHHQLEQQLAEAWPPASWREVTVLTAISGGADSVALLMALQRLSQPEGGRLVAVHFNHGLRGAESDGDERFVVELCQRLGIACAVDRADSTCCSRGGGVEAEARRQRYAFLDETSRCWGARFVATAHTADDQAETILHHIVRGTGLAGLAGIPLTRQLSELTTIVRPLLSVSRAVVEDYLRFRGQAYRQDSSNTHVGFTRNRIRHQLMPMLADQFNPRIVSSLVRLGRLAREAQGVVDGAVEPLWESAIIQRTMDRVELARPVFHEVSPFLLREFLVKIWKSQRWPRKDMDERQWTRLGEFIQSRDRSARSFTLPGPIQAVRDGATVILYRD